MELTHIIDDFYLDLSLVRYIWPAGWKTCGREDEDDLRVAIVIEIANDCRIIFIRQEVFSVLIQKMKENGFIRDKEMYAKKEEINKEINLEMPTAMEMSLAKTHASNLDY